MQNTTPPTSQMGALWKTESWRLTAFLAPGRAVPQEPNWWRELTDELPESRVSNPRQPLFQEHGSWNGGVLTLLVQPGIVNWIFSATPLGEPPSEPTFLGSPSAALATFRPLAHRWLESAPEVNRLAVGSVLIQPTVSRDAGYKVLDEYLPNVKLDIGNISDLLYRINRPRESHVLDGIKINRVSTWSAILVSSLGMPIGMPERAHNTQLYVGARVELDINTTPESATQLRQESLSSLFDELTELGLEIAEHGDVP